MLEGLLPDTRAILDRIEKVSGYTIKLVPDSDAGAPSGKQQVLEDIITVSPHLDAGSADYGVAHSAVRGYRMAMTPPEYRWSFKITPETRELAYERMNKEIFHLPPEERLFSQSVFPVMYESVLSLLEHVPGDFWINQWLYSNFPSFKQEMEKGLEPVFDKAQQGLSENVRLFSPATVYRASHGMYAALGKFLDELLDVDRYFWPYAGTEFEETGQALQELNTEDKGFEGERKVIEKWAEVLGMEGWCELRNR